MGTRNFYVQNASRIYHIDTSTVIDGNYTDKTDIFDRIESLMHNKYAELLENENDINPTNPLSNRMDMNRNFPSECIASILYKREDKCVYIDIYVTCGYYRDVNLDYDIRIDDDYSIGLPIMLSEYESQEDFVECTALECGGEVVMLNSIVDDARSMAEKICNEASDEVYETYAVFSDGTATYKKVINS